MVTNTSGALKNISNSLRKYLHKHREIIFRKDIRSKNFSWLMINSRSMVSCLSVSGGLTPLCANFDNRINPRYLSWFLFTLVFRNTHTKYCNIFCDVFKTTFVSPLVFTIKNQLTKHGKKKHLRKSDIDRGMKYSMTSYLRQSKANHWVLSLMFDVWMQKLFVKNKFWMWFYATESVKRTLKYLSKSSSRNQCLKAPMENVWQV